MNYLDKDTIRQLLNLGQGFIDDSIADRQLEVIRRGFNYINQPENNLLYIGDEVGLGKTYIALGIASLMRHFSSVPEAYQDMILVPKENLQGKWNNAIHHFITYNYLLQDNRVKSVLGKPVASVKQHHTLEPFGEDIPAYQLYRNGTFSFGFGADKYEKLEMLRARLTTSESKALLEKAWQKGYYLMVKKPLLKRLYSYLLNSCMPDVEMLIVDESHNFKHGLSDDGYGTVSDRNQVVSRFMGIWQKADENTELFSDFPELFSMVRPVVQKVIMLSATPKTHELLEMKRQISCFLPQHILSNAQTEEQAKTLLQDFFIRGNLNYNIGGQLYSRNRCRHEHRSGNVVCLPDASPLTFQTDEQAAFLSLLQYKTIGHLDTKHNASFELGMLAGFETFRHDMEMRKSRMPVASSAAQGITDEDIDTAPDAEYEETRTRQTRHSQDTEVVVSLMESYKSAFDEEPPHPKQDALVQAVGEMMLRGVKSLVFVRRLGSAHELERRLNRFFEERITQELKDKWAKRIPSKLLSSWLQEWDNQQIKLHADELFRTIASRITGNRTEYPLTFDDQEDRTTTIIAGLEYLLSNASSHEDYQSWITLLKGQIKRSRYPRELVALSHRLLTSVWRDWERNNSEEESADEEGEEGDTAYFYHSFDRAGMRALKKRIVQSDALELNYYLIHQAIPLGRFDAEKFSDNNIPTKDKSNLREVQRLFLHNVSTGLGIDERATKDAAAKLTESTLLTRLLLQYCRVELTDFVNHAKGTQSLQRDLENLTSILQGVLRKGCGFLPLALALSSQGNEDTFIQMLADERSIFNLALQEVRTIIRDYVLILTANFSEESGEAQRILKKLNDQAPVIGITGQAKKDRSKVAAQFRMPGFPYVLVTTDIFREGEDLHTYCQNIYHYGIAWNCSDMEQRTGRVDRINSLAYRRLTGKQSLDFDNKVHVYYPFINGTLEVNQIACLYESLNSFVETFNDFTHPHLNRAKAHTSAIIDVLPPVIDEQLTSKYEYKTFRDSSDGAVLLQPNPLLGEDTATVKGWLEQLSIGLQKNWKSFYLLPAISADGFYIQGVAQLEDGRRGPFKLQLSNAEAPRRFVLKASSHICTASSRLLARIQSRCEEYNVETDSRFYVLTTIWPISSEDLFAIIRRVDNMVHLADQIEQAVTPDRDEMPW